jgi:hypothetical protein
MPENLFAAEMLPFTVALGLMGLLTLVEVIGLLFGSSLAGLLDSDHNVDAPHIEADAGPVANLLDWLCVGRVPSLILLVIFLTGFGLAGFALQGALQAGIGATLHPALASLGAFATALPITRLGGKIFARIMPKVQTEATSRDSFVGKLAVVTSGIARRGLPAEAKLRDAFGQTHYLRIEPDDDATTLAAGTEVLIVRRAGAVFHAIASARPALTA